MHHINITSGILSEVIELKTKKKKREFLLFFCQLTSHVFQFQHPQFISTIWGYGWVMNVRYIISSSFILVESFSFRKFVVCVWMFFFLCLYDSCIICLIPMISLRDLNSNVWPNGSISIPQTLIFYRKFKIRKVWDDMNKCIDLSNGKKVFTTLHWIICDSSDCGWVKKPILFVKP